MYPENKKMAKSLETTGIGDPKAPHSSTWLGLLLQTVVLRLSPACPLPPSPNGILILTEAETKTINSQRGQGCRVFPGVPWHQAHPVGDRERKKRQQTQPYPELLGGRGLSRGNTSGPRSRAEPCPPGRSLPGPEAPALPVNIVGERKQSPQPMKARPCLF